MIVKKYSKTGEREAPLYLSKIAPFPLEKGLFLDIETNGLSPRSHFIYLIGVLEMAEGACRITQWTAQSPEEERDILLDFLENLSLYRGLIHYNGSRFDLPFLEKRCQVHGISASGLLFALLDLYQRIHPLKSLLGLAGCRFADGEAALGLTREGDVSGKECIHLYQKYYATLREEFLSPILAHNRLDLEHLLRLGELPACEQLLKGAFSVREAALSDRGLKVWLTLPHPLPRPLCFSNEALSLTGEQAQAELELFAVNGKLKKFYAAYRDYYYLPQEDTAVHKSVGAFVDKSRRKNATAQTCYTWFSLAGEFLAPQTLEAYLRENLAPLLGYFPKK